MSPNQLAESARQPKNTYCTSLPNNFLRNSAADPAAQLVKARCQFSCTFDTSFLGAVWLYEAVPATELGSARKAHTNVPHKNAHFDILVDSIAQTVAAKQPIKASRLKWLSRVVALNRFLWNLYCILDVRTHSLVHRPFSVHSKWTVIMP